MDGVQQLMKDHLKYHNGLVFNLNLFKKFANITNLKVFVVGSNSTILNNTNYSGS